jgi:Mg-chelatase subunit ChlD
VEEGISALQPGLMAEANQGILYIDEVNLLPDHITDSILDATASGWNLVEREGISVQHPSRFILVGTMNPEEGELRPQILDRFGIFAETESIQDPVKRTLVIERNEAFRRNSETFRENYKEDILILGDRIQKSRDNLTRIKVPSEFSSLVAETCSRLKVDGFRPDIVTIKVARALAALHDRDQVITEDVETALNFTLGHRTRRSGLSPPPQKKDIRRAMRVSELRQGIGLNLPDVGRYLIVPVEYIARLMRNSLLRKIFQGILTMIIVLSSFFLLEWFRFGITGTSPGKLGLLLEFLLAILFMLALDRIRNVRQTRKPVALGIINQDVDIKTSGRLKYGTSSGGTVGDGNIQSKVSYFGEDKSELVFGPKIMSSLSSLQKRTSNVRVKKSVRKKEGGSSGGRGTRVISRSTRGRYAWYRIPHGKPRDIAFVPTIKAAAAKQFDRRGIGCMVIETEDIREKVREYSSPYSIVLLVDMSLSMIESVANIIQSIYDFHGEVYRRKDRVGLVVFKGSKAYTLQHPTRNLDLVVKKLKEVGASDFTPLAAGLFQSWKTLKQEKLRNKDSTLHLYVISDGIVNVPLDKPISPLTRRRYNSEAHADSFDVLRLLVKEGVNVHIVNTNHNSDESKFVRIKESRITLTPTQFLKELARVSKGEYIGLKKN